MKKQMLSEGRGFPGIKNPPANAGNAGFDPWVGKIPWRRAWQPTPVFLPGQSHGQRSLAGYDGPQGCKEFHATEAIDHKRFLKAC